MDTARLAAKTEATKMNPRHTMAKLGVALGLFGAAVVGAAVFAPGEAGALCMAYRPQSPAYWQAQKAMREGNPSEARRLFLQAEQYPGQAAGWMASAYVSRAYEAERTGKPHDAIAHLRSAIHEQPGNWSAATTMIRFFEKRGQHHDALLAIRSFPTAIASNPSMLRIEARVLQSIGDRAAARKILEKLDGKVATKSN